MKGGKLRIRAKNKIANIPIIFCTMSGVNEKFSLIHIDFMHRFFNGRGDTNQIAAFFQGLFQASASLGFVIKKDDSGVHEPFFLFLSSPSPASKTLKANLKAFTVR